MVKPLVTYGQGWAWGKDSADTPYVYPKLPKIDPSTVGNYDRGSYLADLVGHSGDAARTSRIAAGLRAGDPTAPAAGANPYLNSDGSVNWESLGPGSNHDAVAAIERGWKQQLTRAGNRGVDFNWDTQMNNRRVGLGQDIEGAMEQGLIAEIDPSLAAAQKSADANRDTSAVSASDEAAIRSRFVASAKQDSATRLARINAGLGLGNSANSPAAAALAQQDAQATYSSIASGLSNLSVQTDQMNKQQHAADIQLAVNVAAARLKLLGGNSASIIGMQGDVTSMIDALYSRQQTLALDQQQLDAASSAASAQRTQGYIASGIGLAGAAFTGGASLAAAAAYNRAQSYKGAQ